MDNIKKLIVKVDDGKKISKKSVYQIFIDIGFDKREISKKLKGNDNLKLDIYSVLNGFNIHYTYYHGFFRGYVLGYSKKIPKKFNKKKYNKIFSKKKTNGLNNRELPDGIYNPHGTYTHPHGFDTGHYLDLVLHSDMFKIKNNNKDNIFRSKSFVVNELYKITKSLKKYFLK